MSIFTSLIKKETLHLLRDWRTLTVVLIMPVVLLLLFGFAISTEVNDIRVVAVADRHTDASRLIMERLRVNSYFTFKGEVPFNEASVMICERIFPPSVLRTTAEISARRSSPMLPIQIWPRPRWHT